MSRPGDRPRWARDIPKGADPEEVKQRKEAAQLAARFEHNLEAQRDRYDERAERKRRGAKLSLEEESFEAGHELRDMRTRQVVKYLGLLTIAIVVLVLAISLFESSLIGGPSSLQPVVDAPSRVTPPPEPRLERTNGEVLRVLRAHEEQILNNYTWLDQAAGKVSLPIDRAIELTLQRGLPVRAQQSGQTPAYSALPQGSSSGRTLESIP